MRILKKLRQTLAVLLSCGFAFAFVSGCASPKTNKVSTEYIEAPLAPKYAAVSEEVLENEYKTFYFDALAGDDENSGMSENEPKRSLSEVTDIIASYGTRYPLRILLKRGTTFYGNLKLVGYNATKDRPFILDAYGDGDEYPVIHGVGTAATDVGTLDKANVVHIQEGNTRILNLEITGADCTRGIYVFPRKGGIYENIVVDGCYVHDVNWNWIYDTAPNETNPDDINPEVVTPTEPANRYRRLYGGICIFTGDISNSLGAPVTFRNMWIQNNRVEYVSHVGINFYNYWTNRPGLGYGYNKYVDDTTEHNNYETGVGYFPMENIVVSGNSTNCIGGDGIVLASADNSWLEHNSSLKSNYLGRAGFWNGGLWVANVRNCYYQYNEAGYTYLRHGSSDGEGFDIDNTCENVYMQYNYAHHNEGGGMLICNLQTTMLKFNPDGTPLTDCVQEYWGNWKNNYVRNNVFVNNGNTSDKQNANHHSAFVTIARTTKDVVFENNTVICRGDIKNQHIINSEAGAGITGHVYRNNIFYCESETAQPVLHVSALKDPVFENNLYYNIQSGDPLYGELDLSQDKSAILNIDPGFNKLENYCGYEKVYSFTGSNSVLYNKGISIATMLKYDIKGNDATGVKYLGAFAKKA